MYKDEEFWDKASKGYDKSEERFEYIHHQTGEKAKKYLSNNKTILDYGCGTGTKSCEFSSLVKEIHAIDISSEMIEIAKNKAADGNVENISFSQTTIFDKKYKKESFDVILAFNMLHTIENPVKAIDRIYELLKTDGLFISSTPCLKGRKSLLVSMQMYLVRILSKIGVIPISIRRYRSTDIDHLIKSEKFQTIEAEELYKGASSYFIVAKKAEQK
ncbi:class I SAM-dependent methyltransferase [Thalassomonas sp. RHCl1]|uniref:class I SAM-dependent methyltransferase n=1 Tax=Thalassomonas sp. RHCl1 TaxID=2995320 RepID=UPI00248B18FB|nr:class I SAM-dependent methyltransferase [Thalassomonas sp. RHCl1]